MITQAVRQGGTVLVGALADEIGVSETTIRRDLSELEAEGVLRRVHGGALALDYRDDPFQVVATVNADAKSAIGARCSDMVADGQTVILDIGTTAARIAEALRGRRLTVVTSNLVAVDILADEPDIDVIVLGGLLRREYRSLVGFLTEDALRQVRADILFLSTSGVRSTGDVMDSTVVEVPVKRAMLAASERVVLAADASKFPGHGSARVAGPDEIDVLVTNGSLDTATRSSLIAAGVTVEEA